MAARLHPGPLAATQRDAVSQLPFLVATTDHLKLDSDSDDDLFVSNPFQKSVENVVYSAK